LGNSDEGAETINERGWRQGSVLPPSSFGILSELSGTEFNPGQHCAVVASQDCDVVHCSYKTEPSVEIVRGVRRKRLDGNLAFGKSGRKLQLEFSTADGPMVFELSIHERFLVDRRILEDVEPDATVSLSSREKRTLAGWLAKRYKRHAFPDEFNRRLKEQPHSDDIRNLFKAYGQEIEAVFVLLQPEDEELSAGESYVVNLYAVMASEDYDDTETRTRLEEEFINPLEASFGAFTGIELGAAMLVSDEDFSLADIGRTRRMDLDDLSYRDDSPMLEDDG
jgi:hypothetical protein